MLPLLILGTLELQAKERLESIVKEVYSHTTLVSIAFNRLQTPSRPPSFLTSLVSSSRSLQTSLMSRRISFPLLHYNSYMLPSFSLLLVQQIADILLKYPVDGIVVSNTTTSRPDYIQSPHIHEKGGLSGAPLKSLSTQSIYDMYELTEGKINIVGVGGISSGKDAYEKIKAGASVVEVYSALVYHGI